VWEPSFSASFLRRVGWSKHGFGFGDEVELAFAPDLNVPMSV
jgi:hypothetical protein